MSQGPQVTVTLTAEDSGLASALKSLSTQIQKLPQSSEAATRQMKAHFTSLSTMLKEMGDSVKLRLANIPGLGSFGSSAMIRAYEPLGKLAEQAGSDLEERFGTAALAIGGVSAALVALSAISVGVTHHMVDLAQSIENESAATGLTTRQVQELTEVAKEMGVDAGSLEMAFARISSQLGEFAATGKAAGSGSQYFVRILRSMGVALTNAQGELRPTNQIVADFYDQVSQIPDAGERAALEMAAFGTRGRVIAQVFEEARREGLSYRDMLASIDASGNVISDSQLASLLEAKRRWDELTRATRGFFTTMGGFIAESVTSWRGLERAIAETAAAMMIWKSSASAQALADKWVPENTVPGGTRPGGASAAEVERLGKLSDENEALEQRNTILRAGGAEQAKLLQDEKDYTQAMLNHDLDLLKGDTARARIASLTAQALLTQIGELKTAIELEAEHKGKSPAQQEAEFVEEQNARIMRNRIERYKELGKAGKQSLQGILELETKLDAAQREAARGQGENYLPAALGTMPDVRSSIAAQEQAMEARRRSIALDEQLGASATGKNGYETERLRLQIQQDEVQLTKAEMLGQKQLAQAFVQVIEKEKQMLAIDTQVVTKKQMLKTVSSGLTNDFDLMFQSIGRGAHSMQQAFRQMEMGVIGSLENVAAKMAASVATMILTGQLWRLQKAKESATGAYSDVMHMGLPFPVDIILASANAARAFEQAMAFAKGGLVRGPGGPTGDRIPAMLSDGEYVMRASAVSSIGLPRLESMNAGDLEPGGVHVHLHPSITNNLFHHGKDAQQVLEEELVPRITDAIRNGALKLP